MKRILVIEDEAAVRANILEILDSGGYAGIGAENGRAGLETAQRERPDLILCDIMLPELDGYAILRALRQDARTTAIPLIFLTAKVDRDDVRHGMELGADDYIAKPFRRLDLLRAISARLQRRQELLQQAERQLKDLRSSINLALPHELRTALTGILGFSELISTHSNILELAELAEMGRAIYDSSTRLQHLLDNFLVYARLELLAADAAHVIALRQEGTSGAGDVVQALAVNKAQTLGRRHDLEVTTVDCMVAMSVAYFSKLCEELVDNAFKYSAPGTPVNVTAEIMANRLRLTIRDQGRGMTPQQMADIGAYVQFDRQTFERRGVGLGLIIAQRLAEIHGGWLRMASEAGVGTTISVELPLAQETARLSAAHQAKVMPHTETSDVPWSSAGH